MKQVRFLSVLCLFLFALAGGMLSACTAKTSTTGSALTVQTTTAASANTTTASGQTTATTVATTSGTTLPGGIPAIADRKSLPSYRYTIMTKIKEGDGAGSLDYMKYEFVRDQKAEHAWREDAGGKVTETYITIGDKTWIWFPSMGWVEQPPKTPAETSIPSDLADQLKKAQQDLEKSKMRFEKKGTETVNKVPCIQYEYEYYLTIEMPNLATGGTIKTEMHEKGSLWLADQSGLPAVVIRSAGTTEIDAAGEKTVLESDQNLTDIGAAISIKPPEGAKPPPTGTVKPTGTTAATSTTTAAATTAATSTTTTQTSGTLLFGDEFQGDAWDANWQWLDPNDDAQYSLTARAGFLRLTVPDGNDLAGVANYDAPRLLVPQQGDFSLETLIEFDPQEAYQGAGLLVWQDEATFLRLEFGFGGMGGEDKNVVFVQQKEGNLELVDKADLPESAKRIELRLQREGNELTAWYRLAGGAWLKIGSVESDLADSVQVGLAQVTQYTTVEISADFDYLRVFSE
jgi:regulation of enolase protein 1 (concanavalin A-like superfamily)